MKIIAGEAVTITAKSSNSIDPPVEVQWKPQTGKTQLTVTITAKDGTKQQHVFDINAVVVH